MCPFFCLLIGLSECLLFNSDVINIPWHLKIWLFRVSLDYIFENLIGVIMIRNGQYMVIDLLIHNSMGRLFVNCSFCIDPRHCSFNEFPFIS